LLLAVAVEVIQQELLEEVVALAVTELQVGLRFLLELHIP
jgi:hypothetical protein